MKPPRFQLLVTRSARRFSRHLKYSHPANVPIPKAETGDNDGQSCSGVTGGFGLAGDVGASPRISAEGRSGRGMGCLRAAASRIRTVLQHFHQYRDRQAPWREAVRLVSRAARLAGAHRGLSRGRRGAIRRCRREGAGERRTDGGRCRHCRDRLLDRDCDAKPRGAGRRPDGLPLRRHARAGVRARLRRRRLGAVDRVAPRAGAAGHQRAAGRRSNSARSRFASTNSPRPTSSPPACSATAPPRSCCARAMAARRRSRLPANIFGRTRSASWAGMSIPTDSASSFAAPSRISSRASRPRRDAKFSRSMRLSRDDDRSVHLPSRRRQGHHRAGTRAARSTRARSTMSGR